ncbi:MAG: phosphodiester glycosidase family protein [Candidatus Marinimicrobia bacterium]|nr:phosphodiester glycosidase family protein [Candidatus Neomarinimicrobiota bacterium]
MRLYVFIMILLATFFLGAEEIAWTDITTQYSFPDGIRLIKGNRSTPILECFYLEVDLNDTNLAVRPYLSSTSRSVQNFASDAHCIAAVNGGYFGGGIPYSTVIYPGEIKAVNVPSVTRNSNAYPVIRSMFSLSNDFKPNVNWVYHFGQALTDVYRFDAPLDYTYNDPQPEPAPVRAEGTLMDSLLIAIGGGPILVKDSTINITYNEEVMWGSGVGLDNRDPRTAIGYTRNDHIIILVADGRQAHSEGLSLSDMATLFLELGCVAAINLDGGGSTQMAVPGTYINRPSEERLVPAIFAITYRDSCQIPQESGYSMIIDSEDSWASRMGSWFPSANAGYWGDTKALLSGCGDGSSILRYYTALTQTTSCDVYGWWVADPNRSSETPFVIIHQDGRDTVRVNQREDHAQWNKLGTYTFTSDPEQAVIVSNLASTGNYVVADAIKLTAETPISLLEPTEILSEYPMNFDLLSIYPNPFNPQTTINYELKNDTDVKMQLFDIKGDKIMDLIDQRQRAGDHHYCLSGNDLASGIYICSLSYDEIQIKRKITLLK